MATGRNEKGIRSSQMSHIVYSSSDQQGKSFNLGKPRMQAISEETRYCLHNISSMKLYALAILTQNTNRIMIWVFLIQGITVFQKRTQFYWAHTKSSSEPKPTDCSFGNFLNWVAYFT